MTLSSSAACPNMTASIHTLVGDKVAYSNIGMTDRSKFRVALKRQLARPDATLVMVDLIDPMEGIDILTRVIYSGDENGNPVREVIGTVSSTEIWTPEEARWEIGYYKGLRFSVYQIQTTAANMAAGLNMDPAGEILYTDPTNFVTPEGLVVFLYTVKGDPKVWGTAATII
jgi:hypothetical protein